MRIQQEAKENREGKRSSWVGEPLYVGVDLHKNKSWITAMTKEGQVRFSFELRNKVESWQKVLQLLPEGSKIVFEASWNWFWLLELIGERFEVSLAHPLRTKAIASAKLKNDRVDSHMLAHLLRTQLLPQAYIPPREIRDLRELVRFRATLTRISTIVANKIHALLAKNGLSLAYSQVFGKKSLLWLRNLQLRWPYKSQLEAYILLGEQINRLKEALMEKIKREAEARQEVRLLRTMPGVGDFLALLMVAEIGDIERFASPAKLVSYAGLSPAVRCSGGRRKRGRLAKEGNKWLRWAAVEVAMHIKRLSPHFAAYYNRLAARKGKPTAQVATARKVLQTVWFMLKHKQGYIEKGASEHLLGTAP